ncbi:GNAT family N-acetyltransferase [Hyphomicrobium sp. 2TAF46]|uniref:GNAT family N-acetyltransferase n=1 Tax=Hyphomicrobium sp. 2TAF46 TaxID=3233019 RepID=UPI003F90F0E7
MQLVQIRRFVEGDADAIWSLHRCALTLVGASGPTGSGEDDLRDIPRFYLSSRDFLACAADDVVVAMGGWRHLSPTHAELKRMRVEPSLQGRGFGRRTLEALDESARITGDRDVGV